MKTNLLLIAALLIGFGSRAHADNWSFTLDNIDQVTQPGSTLIYTGQLTNTTGADLPLLSLSLDPPAGTSNNDYTIDYTSEFQSAIFDAGYVIPTTGYSGSIFAITFTPSAPVDLVIPGSLDLTVDFPGDPATIIQSFTATTVPAPSSLVTVLFGIVPGVLLHRRRMR